MLFIALSDIQPAVLSGDAGNVAVDGQIVGDVVTTQVVNKLQVEEGGGS